jgi:Catalase
VPRVQTRRLPPNNRATGGETHQRVPDDADHTNADAHLATNQGIRISDKQNSLKAGARGPALLEDFVLREKIFHFDHSALFDAIASILIPEQADKLAHDGAAVQWFMDAIGHCKTIGHCPGTQVILDKSGVEKDDEVVPIEQFAKSRRRGTGSVNQRSACWPERRC